MEETIKNVSNMAHPIHSDHIHRITNQHISHGEQPADEHPIHHDRTPLQHPLQLRDVKR